MISTDARVSPTLQSRMRFTSIVLRCARWTNLLPRAAGHRLKARTSEFHAASVNSNAGSVDSESFPLSQNSDIRYLASEKLKWNRFESMSEEVCEKGSGAVELRSRPYGSVAGGANLEIRLDCNSSSGTENRECRVHPSQVDDSFQSVRCAPASSAEADSSMSQSSWEKGSFVGVGNSSLNYGELANCLDIDDGLVHVASQNGQDNSVPKARGASVHSKQTKPQIPVSGRESEEIENAPKYPVPLTPFSGEMEKSIEYERAMVAETAMKSGPSISRSDILFEDEWLMVINKPCGIYSEHVLATIPSLLQTRAPVASDSSTKEENEVKEQTHIHMANRLDRDTSGVMVITKSKKAAGKMSRIFTSRWVRKSYLALCAAPPPEWKHMTVESGHGRSRFGAWRVYAKRDIGKELPGKCVVRDMRTDFVVVAVNRELVSEQMDCGNISTGRSWCEEEKAEDNLVIAGEEQTRNCPPYVSDLAKDIRLEKSSGGSLCNSGDEVIIRAFPFTGRTHQIRLHCQYIGLPLRGDVKYGGPHIWNGIQYDHHALHAETLSFRHPFTSEKLFFVAPLPRWAKDAGVQPHQE